MFTELAPILNDRAITITLAAEGDGIRVNVIPHSRKGADDKEGKDKSKESVILTEPFTVVGSAEELDAELGGLLAGFVSHRATAAASLAAFEERAAAERKRIEDEAAKLNKAAQKTLDEAKGKKKEAEKKAGVKPEPETANMFGGDDEKDEDEGGDS